MLALLAHRSEGNPFFLEQLIATLRDADGIVVRDGVAGLRPDTTDIATPASLHGLIQARLDQLSAPANRTGGRLVDLAARDLLRQGMAEARALAEEQWPSAMPRSRRSPMARCWQPAAS